MRSQRPIVLALAAALLAATSSATVLAANYGWTFTYQGKLDQSGSPVSGPTPMSFRLYDSSVGGSPVGNPINQSVGVTGGLFTVNLDFTEGGVVRAVDGIDFKVKRGQVVGLVGESGCGKSVTSLSIMRLIAQPGRIVEGQIIFDNTDLVKLPENRMVEIRGNRVSMIFQQPQSSLNPVFRVGEQLSEVLQIHQEVGKEAGEKRAVEFLAMVGVPDPERRVNAFPHELSGGMAQRVMIAMALACVPELLIADEPTTALDAVVQRAVTQPNSYDIADIEYWMCKKVFPANTLQAMDVKKIKYFDKIVPIFTSGKLKPDSVIAQGTAPNTVSFVEGPGSTKFAKGQTGWFTMIPTIYNADTLGIRPDQAESYGKAAIVGENGEWEHAAAILHPKLGAPLRKAVEKGAALVPSVKKLGGPGTAIDIPLGHKDAAFVRSHFDGIEVRLADAPRANEILVAVAVTDSGRPFPRVGGLQKHEIKGQDGLR